jgi:hypothetical protein
VSGLNFGASAFVLNALELLIRDRECEMKTPPVIPCILPNEFCFFAELLCDDEMFPKTYASWLQRAYRDEKEGVGKSIDVHPQEFADYCRRHKAQPKLATLKVFASNKAAGLLAATKKRSTPPRRE